MTEGETEFEPVNIYMIRCWHKVSLALLPKEGEVVWNWSSIKEGEVVWEGEMQYKISTGNIMKEGAAQQKCNTNVIFFWHLTYC